MTTYSDFIKAEAKKVGLTYKQAQRDETIKQAYRDMKKAEGKKEKKSMTSIEYLASTDFIFTIGLEYISDEKLEEMANERNAERIELSKTNGKDMTTDIKQKLKWLERQSISILNERIKRLEKQKEDVESNVNLNLFKNMELNM